MFKKSMIRCVILILTIIGGASSTKAATPYDWRGKDPFQLIDGINFFEAISRGQSEELRGAILKESIFYKKYCNFSNVFDFSYNEGAFRFSHSFVATKASCYGNPGTVKPDDFQWFIGIHWFSTNGYSNSKPNVVVRCYSGVSKGTVGSAGLYYGDRKQISISGSCTDISNATVIGPKIFQGSSDNNFQTNPGSDYERDKENERQRDIDRARREQQFRDQQRRDEAYRRSQGG